MKAAYGRVSEVRAVPSHALARIVVDLPIEVCQAASDLFTGADVLVTISPENFGAYGVLNGDDEAPSKEAKPDFGKYYQVLYKSGWWNNPKVAAAWGKDEQYQEWVRLQPSCISGDFSEWVNGEGRCVYAHVRRVSAGAGVALKPMFSGVPLTDPEHQLQHHAGEIRLGRSPAWFEQQAARYRADWIKSRIYALFHVSSLAEIAPADFVAECQERGIDRTLPAVFLGVAA